MNSTQKNTLIIYDETGPKRLIKAVMKVGKNIILFQTEIHPQELHEMEKKILNFKEMISQFEIL